MDAVPRDYNYVNWVPDPSEFVRFANEAPKATSRAPSFPLEDLETGGTIQMKELWKGGIALIEFGSFT